jgi:hypothetical protein
VETEERSRGGAVEEAVEPEAVHRQGAEEEGEAMGPAEHRCSWSFQTT